MGAEPAFISLPSANEIAHWFVEDMRGEQNAAGAGWGLSSDPHSSCWMLAHVDHDTQEFWLLEITTGDSKDLLWVTNGIDGLGCQWWQNPTSARNGDSYWHCDGIKWMADQIVVHDEWSPPNWPAPDAQGEG